MSQIVFPSKDMLDPYPPVLQNVALFGYRVAAEVIKMRSYWNRVGPYPNITGVFTRRDWNTDSEGRAQCKD